MSPHTTKTYISKFSVYIYVYNIVAYSCQNYCHYYNSLKEEYLPSKSKELYGLLYFHTWLDVEGVGVDTI